MVSGLYRYISNPMQLSCALVMSVCASVKCALKAKGPRFVSEAQKDYALLMCPRYMNVPLPAPCHVNVAGVGKQSVWGLRIIARSKL